MSSQKHREMFDALQTMAGVQVRYKNESRFMRLIGLLMFFNRSFMTGYTTTIGVTVYFPSRAFVDRDPYHAWEVLAHEIVHAEDYRASKMWFGVKYLFPQCLAVLALLAPVLWSWWPLAFLLFLAPIPAPWRTHYEMRGYAMSLAVHYWYLGDGIPVALKQHVADAFTGPSYLYMWPFKTAVANRVNDISRRILCDEIFEDGPVYQSVRDEITRRLHA